MTTRLTTSLIAISTAFATPVLADVTAADVWSNQQAFYSASGVTLGGTLSDGTLVDPQLNMILPMGLASMQITTDATLSMVENSDGTVTITYPSPMALTIAGGAPNEGSFTTDLMMTHDGYTVIASGNPGDVSYMSDAQNLRIEVVDFALEDTTENMALNGFFDIARWTGTAQVIEGDLISYSSQSETGLITTDFTFDSDNITSISKQVNQPTQTTVAMTLPAGGSDVMNLSAALRNGLSVLVQSTGDGNISESITLLNDEELNRQTTTVGAQTGALSLGEAGVTLSAQAEGFGIVMDEQLILPAPLEIAMERITADYNLPLIASPDTTNFRVATGLFGITIGEAVWGMFDPAGQLPRDPAEISFDVTGSGTNGMDLLDFAAWMQLPGTPPIEVNDVTIENLNIKAVGAQATATGAMTFDWTDFQTFPGIARPEGQVTVNLNGANALMDTLSAMGLIPAEDLMMPRMMMGMFATVVGDDMLESVIEVNSEGHLLANGQRLQ